jgi:hypothetical protein
MRKIIFSFIALAVLAFYTPAAAQTALAQSIPPAGITPESPFHFFDIAFENVRMFFTFDKEAKVRLHSAFASERASEVAVMLGKERINKNALKAAFDNMKRHTASQTVLMGQITAEGKDAALLIADISAQLNAINAHLANTKRQNIQRLEAGAEVEQQQFQAKLTDPAFAASLEELLRKIASEIDQEVNKPLSRFNIIPDSQNIDVDIDTYSATYRAEIDMVPDLAVLRDQILRNVSGWESKDITLDNDSLDITFEKAYPSAVIEGIEFIPDASVTISITINSPETGMTAINYDIDITLETKHEHLIDMINDLMDKQEDILDEKKDAMEDLLGAKISAERLIQELEKSKRDLLDEAALENVTIPAQVLSAFDALLSQARFAFDGGNYEEAGTRAREAEKVLDRIGSALDDLIDAKKEEKELQEKALEIQSKLQERGTGNIDKLQEKNKERLEKQREKIEKEKEKAEEKLREAANDR